MSSPSSGIGRTQAFALGHDRKRPRQLRSAVPPALTSQTVIIGSGLLRLPREADTHPCILSWTPTHQMLRPALNGLARRHTRLLAERKILSRDTASAVPPDSRSLHTATTSRSRLPEGRLFSLNSPQSALGVLSSLGFSSTTGFRAFAMGSPLWVGLRLFPDALDRNEDSF